MSGRWATLPTEERPRYVLFAAHNVQPTVMRFLATETLMVRPSAASGLSGPDAVETTNAQTSHVLNRHHARAFCYPERVRRWQWHPKKNPPTEQFVRAPPFNSCGNCGECPRRCRSYPCRGHA